jgi:GNAT superfamily N-acetyltransferase
MPSTGLRPMLGGDIEAVQLLASRLWPDGWHPGGLGWALVRNQMGDVVVAESDGEIVGWASRDGTEVHVQIDPADGAATELLAEWACGSEADHDLNLRLWQPSMAEAAQRRGMVDAGREEWSGLFRAVAGAVADPRRKPLGYTLRSVDPSGGENEGRVAVHRAAWRPASLPYTDGREVDLSAESPFVSDTYRAVRGTWLYDPDFDLVAEAEDGSFGASCIAWYDPATGVAEIEPMGVVPEHRRRGLAVALCLEVAARVEARGGSEVFINHSPQPDYPAPSAAYFKAGFVLRERTRTFVRA